MRAYHSPSSISLALRCRHAWALRYVAGLKEPELTWADIEAGAPHKPIQRSKALGTAAHAVLESWYMGETPAWSSFPGEVVRAGLHELPHPDRVHVASVEASLGEAPPRLGVARGQSRKLVPVGIDGVRWSGKRDLLVSAPAEFTRLGIDAPDGWAVIDYKTSASIERYALSAAELREDVQANIYAASTGIVLDVPAVPMRWVYFETKRVRRAAPVDVTLERGEAVAYVAERLNTVAREIDAITLDDLPHVDKNPMACSEYGGCPYHKDNGGPCDARRSVGGYIQARVKRTGKDMALNPGASARFQGLKARVAQTGAAATAAAAPPPEAPPAPPPPPPEAPPAPAPAKRGRPPKAAAPAPAPEAPAEPAAEGLKYTIYINHGDPFAGPSSIKFYGDPDTVLQIEALITAAASGE